MADKKTKILIAAGGTGGHIFPAQALASQLSKRNEVEEVVFAGHGLGGNRYFLKEQFPYHDVSSGTVFKGGIFKVLKALLTIGKGTFEAFRILKRFCPDLVVGFGSFHSFPLLLAAFLKRVPIVLFESNSIPGKVNRLFSKWAVLSAIQFPQAAEWLKGKTAEVEMPLWKSESFEDVNEEQARLYYGLDPSKPTLLIFGGSQGAVSINHIFCRALEQLEVREFQVIHLAGDRADLDEIRRSYKNLQLNACVKAFEDRMHHAWKAATLAICRCGAATFAEQVFFEVPAILIPYPHAADNHQQKNGEFMQGHVGGAVVIAESELNGKDLADTIQSLFDPCKSHLSAMKENIRNFKNCNKKYDLCSLICDILNKD
jgi:UDP-N-acetylglucosamine--N-acetylmuramyl-(pentapeptide) pyrophosphoryl-undecaprenol N-acetylglucosamine transferase